MGQNNIKYNEELSESYNPIAFANMKQPKEDEYYHQFERDYLLTLNLVRSNLKFFKNWIKYYKQKYEEFKDE